MNKCKPIYLNCRFSTEANLEAIQQWLTLNSFLEMAPFRWSWSAHTAHMGSQGILMDWLLHEFIYNHGYYFCKHGVLSRVRFSENPKHLKEKWYVTGHYISAHLNISHGNRSWIPLWLLKVINVEIERVLIKVSSCSSRYRFWNKESKYSKVNLKSKGQ